MLFAFCSKAQATITIATEITNATCRYDNGVIIATALGGVAPYTYSISNYSYYSKTITSKVSPVFANLHADWYIINVVDLIGDTASSMVFVDDKYETFDFTLSVNARPHCAASDGMFTVIAKNGLAPYLYSIDDGIHYQTSNVFSNLTTGYYAVFVKDANGCVVAPWWSKVAGSYLNFVSWGQIIGYYLTTTCDLSFSAFYPMPGCGNYAYMLPYVPKGGTPPYVYSLDGGSFATLPTGTRYSGLTSGRHTIVMKDAVGATTSVSMDFASNCFALVTTNTPCNKKNGTIAVTAANGIRPVTYSIDGKNFQTDSMFLNLSSGTYSVIVKDVNGATVTGDAVVTNNCPIVMAIATNDTCMQKKGYVNATGTNGTPPYIFSIDGVKFQSSNIFNGLGAGNYIITVKDANGFTNVTNATVKNTCLQVTLINTGTTCSNSNGTITATGANGVPPYQYSINGVNFQTSNVFTSLFAGNYAITIKDTNGVTGTANTTIADAPAPQITVLVKQPGCNNTGGIVTVKKSGGIVPFFYSITNGTSFQNDSVFSNLIAKEYIVYVKDGNGCMARDTVQLSFPTSPTVFLGNDTVICQGSTIILSAPQATGYSYLWQDNSTASQYDVGKSGTYSIKVTSANGCSTADTIMVSVAQLPVFALGKDTSLCNGQILRLNPLLPTATYLWNTGSTASSIQITSTASYWLKVSDGGCSSSDTILVKFNPNPIIDLGSDTTICVGQTILLSAQNAGATYLWQDGSKDATYLVNKQGYYKVKVSATTGCDTTGSLSVVQTTKPIVYLGNDTTLCQTDQLVLNATYLQASYEWQDGSALANYTVKQAGNYYVQVSNNCGATKDTIKVSYENCACKFFMPTAFTPNRDGKNDIFRPNYKCLFNNYTIRIYNRFGQTVFVGQNPDDGWDGTMNSQQQAAGSYVWEVGYMDKLLNRQITKKGLVTLIR